VLQELDLALAVVRLVAGMREAGNRPTLFDLALNVCRHGGLAPIL
jgi:hypothetical protein